MLLARIKHDIVCGAPLATKTFRGAIFMCRTLALEVYFASGSKKTHYLYIVGQQDIFNLKACSSKCAPRSSDSNGRPPDRYFRRAKIRIGHLKGVEAHQTLLSATNGGTWRHTISASTCATLKRTPRSSDSATHIFVSAKCAPRSSASDYRPPMRILLRQVPVAASPTPDYA